MGDQLLREETGTAPKHSETVERGQQVFAEWLDDNDVEIDPQYGLDLAEGEVGRIDTNLSFAVSDEAVAAGDEAADAAYAKGLPDSQRCG